MNFGEIWYTLSEEILFETLIHIWSHITENKNKMVKIQNWKFHNSLNSCGRYPARGMHFFVGSESDVYFQRRCRLKCSLPYSPMLAKTKKKKSSTNFKFNISKNKTE